MGPLEVVPTPNCVSYDTGERELYSKYGKRGMENPLTTFLILKEHQSINDCFIIKSMLLCNRK